MNHPQVGINDIIINFYDFLPKQKNIINIINQNSPEINIEKCTEQGEYLEIQRLILEKMNNKEKFSVINYEHYDSLIGFLLGAILNVDKSINKTQFVVLSSTHELSKKYYEDFHKIFNNLDISFNYFNDKLNKKIFDPSLVHNYNSSTNSNNYNNSNNSNVSELEYTSFTGEEDIDEESTNLENLPKMRNNKFKDYDEYNIGLPQVLLADTLCLKELIKKYPRILSNVKYILIDDPLNNMCNNDNVINILRTLNMYYKSPKNDKFKLVYFGPFSTNENIDFFKQIGSKSILFNKLLYKINGEEIIYDFEHEFNILDTTNYITRAKKLVYNGNFTLPYVPENITHLKIGIKSSFDKPIDSSMVNLTHLEIENNYNTVIESYPPNLIHLKLGNKYNHPIDNIPTTIQYLDIGNSYKIQLPDLINFDSLVELHIGKSYHKRIDSLPESIGRIFVDKPSQLILFPNDYHFMVKYKNNNLV